MAIVWWPFYARLVRGEVARLNARPHIEAAKLADAAGAQPCQVALGVVGGAFRVHRDDRADDDTGRAAAQ